MVVRRIIQWLDPADPKRLAEVRRLYAAFEEQEGEEVAELLRVREQRPEALEGDVHGLEALALHDKARALFEQEVELWERRRQLSTSARVLCGALRLLLLPLLVLYWIYGGVQKAFLKMQLARLQREQAR